MESGQRAEGFLRAVGAGRYHVAHRKETCPESIVGTVLKKISGEVGLLTRDEFYEFSNELCKWWHDYDNASAVVRLPGKAYGEDSYPGLRAGKNVPQPQSSKQNATSGVNKNKSLGGTASHSGSPLAGLNESLTDGQVKVLVEDAAPSIQKAVVQESEVKMKRVISSNGMQRVANKGASYSRHNSAPATGMQSYDKKIAPKKQQKAEQVFVQSVETAGFWVTFNPNSIGKVDRVGHPPSGWCPLNGQVVLPAVGDEMKVVFDPDGLGYREGFCLVRQVQ